MKTQTSMQLLRLARDQQMRIWLDRLLECTPAPLWWCAGVLVAGGALHRLLTPLNALAVLCIALLPAFLYLSWKAVAVKPAANQGAAAADRLFGANSLFLCAWELSHTAAVTRGVGPLVMKRAEAQLPEWFRRAGMHPRRYLNPAVLAAVSIGATGVFFLYLPPQAGTLEVTASRSGLMHAAANKADDPAAVLGELFKSEETAATALSAQHRGQPNQPDSKARIPSQHPGEIDRAEQAGQAGISDPLAAAEGPVLPTDGKHLDAGGAVLPKLSETGGHRLSKRTPGSDSADPSGERISAAAAFERIERIGIETGTDTRNTAFDSSREGRALLSSQTGLPASDPLLTHRARTIAPTDPATVLSAEQRSLVWLYIQQLDKIDETNE